MKPALVLAATLLAAASCIAAAQDSTAALQDGVAAAQDSASAAKIRTGYAINPVPLNVKGKNPALVGLGSYIVNAQGGCNDCHTAPAYVDGGDPFLGQEEQINVEGYLAGGTPFGPFLSRNLTPNSRGRPAGLTLDQFLFVMNTGADVKGRPPFVPSEAGDLLQVMPWPVYRHMSDHEKRAIYEYLRAIPCRGSAERCGG